MKLIPNLAPVDRRAIDELGIAGLQLMEEAGKAVANRVVELAAMLKLKPARVTLVCGRGNNGGDGFVIARLLATVPNFVVTVVHTASAEQLRGDALTNFNRLERDKITLVSAENEQAVMDAISSATVLVDALYGSGISRPLEGPDKALVEAINRAVGYTVAVDIPSGIRCETGEVMGVAVEADETVTFAVAKPGLFLYPGKAHAGFVTISDIGIPQRLIDEEPSRIELLTPERIKPLLPKRVSWSHKYTYGAVLVIAGSRKMPGAAVMTAEAALRAGAGVVTLAAPAGCFQQMPLPPEIIRLPLPETEDGFLCEEAVPQVTESLNRMTTIALGPGIGATSSVLDMMRNLLPVLTQHFEGTVVMDADGLNVLAQLEPTPVLSPRFVLTPHLGECARLTALSAEDIHRDLMAACRKTAEQYQATVILKSASTVISEPSGSVWINPTGDPGMATAGSGDILTGLVAGFAAQGLPPAEAACVATYLHGLSGSEGASELSSYCLTATDLLRYLPRAIRFVQAFNNQKAGS